MEKEYDFGKCAYVEPQSLNSYLQGKGNEIAHIVALFNRDVVIYDKKGKENDFKFTLLALSELNRLFYVGILKRVLPSRINIKVHGEYYTLSGYNHRVYTASVRGDTINFAADFVLGDVFNRENNHYGPNPPGVTHYAFLMIHEYGHILFRSIEKLPIGYREMAVREFIGSNIEFIKCWKQVLTTGNQDLSEWFADVFARACIRVLYPNLYTLNRPRSKRVYIKSK